MEPNEIIDKILKKVYNQRGRFELSPLLREITGTTDNKNEIKLRLQFEELVDFPDSSSDFLANNKTNQIGKMGGYLVYLNRKKYKKYMKIFVSIITVLGIIFGIISFFK